MGINRNWFVLLLFLFTMTPALLKLTVYRDFNEDNDVLRRVKRGDEDTKQPSKDIAASQSQKGFLDSIFSSHLDSMGILSSLRSIIPIGGNNLLNMRGKRAPNEYNTYNNENRVHIAKRSLLDYDENAPNNNIADEANNLVENIQNDTLNEAITTETENKESSVNNINSNGIYNETAIIQNDDLNSTVTQHSNGTVGNETVDGNDNSTATNLNEDGSDANLRSGASRNVTYDNNETASEAYQNMTSPNNDSYYNSPDLMVTTSDLTLSFTANDTTDNSILNSRNDTNSGTLNDNINDVNQASFQMNTRSAYETQNSNNETIIQENLSSNGSQNNKFNDAASSDNPLELNVTVREADMRNDNLNSSMHEAKLNIIENNNTNIGNNPPETNIFLNTRRSNSGPNNNNDIGQNSLTDLKNSLNNLILENILNAANNANNTEKVILVNSLNDTSNGNIKDSINKINAVNNRNVDTPHNKEDNINLNLNATGTQLTYIHNLLVNFYFS